MNLYTELWNHMKQKPLKAMKVFDPELKIPKIIMKKDGEDDEIGDRYSNVQEDSI